METNYEWNPWKLTTNENYVVMSYESKCSFCWYFTSFKGPGNSLVAQKIDCCGPAEVGCSEARCTNPAPGIHQGFTAH